MKKANLVCWIICIALFVIFSCGKNNSIETPPLSQANVSTTSPSNIATSSATLGGNVTSDGNAIVTERGIVYSTTQTPTVSLTKVVVGSGKGIYTTNITGLIAGTTYYIRAYAVNSQGIAYGGQESFTCTQALSMPVVTTTPASAVTSTGATLGGNVTSDGNAGVSERGVTYATSQNPTTANTKISVGNSTGIFNTNVTGLTPGTTYYVRAYAINSQGTAYGNQEVFICSQAQTIPTITTTPASAVTSTSVTLGGNVTLDGNAAVSEKGVVYATTANPTTANTKVIVGTGGIGSFTTNINSLTPGTTYYVRAYAINNIGTAYGLQETFTCTLTVSLPTVTTTPATSITSSTATLGGNVTSDGNATVSEKGVVYATTANPTTANTKVIVGTGGIGSFTTNINSLTPGNTYYVRAYAINSMGTAYGLQETFTCTLTVSLPTVTTTPAAGITSSTATLGGNVTSDGNATVSEKGVVYATTANPTTANTKIVVGTGGIGIFTTNVTGLIAGTTYYVRAYAINNMGTAYGTQETFTCTLTVSMPTVTTIPAASITSSGATLGGNVTSDGNATVSEKGVVYATTANPTIANTKVIVGTGGIGSFTTNLNSLTPGTTYYVRAYAINSMGTAYGLQETFTCTLTVSLPTVTTTPATSITSSTATLGGNVTSDGNATVSEKGVVYATTANPTTANTKVIVGTGGIGSFTTNLNSLTPGTTYYVRAYAINSMGTAYGLQETFTCTLTVSLPTVTTTPAAGITSSTATLGGNVTSDGNATVSEKGVVYATTANPTTANTKVVVGTGGIGSFTTNLNSLTTGTTYYVRAYAINSQGTAYGLSEEFTTALIDADGNIYATKSVGSKVWMASNLKVTKFNDNTDIPLITSASATPGYCWYNNDAATNKNIYGALYNWYAVNTGKLCPTGWHVPAETETSFNSLGGDSIAGGKLKEAGTSHWKSPNTGATNESGFTALPGGYAINGEFKDMGSFGNWWYSTEYSATNAGFGSLYYLSKEVLRNNNDKRAAFSVRCMRDK